MENRNALCTQHMASCALSLLLPRHAYLEGTETPAIRLQQVSVAFGFLRLGSVRHFLMLTDLSVFKSHDM